MSKHSSESTRSKPHNRAVRLIFEQKSGKVKLVSMQRANMVVPPPQALASDRSNRGSWFELRDKQNRPVYRRVIENPLQDIEVVVDDPVRPLQRVRVDQARRAFFLIVPDITGVRRLALNLEPRQMAMAASGKRGKSIFKPAMSSLHEFDFSIIDKRRER